MHASFVVVARSVALLTAGILLISIALIGYFLRPLRWPGRTVALITGCCLCVPIDAVPAASIMVAVAGVFAATLLVVEVRLKRRATVNARE